MMCCRMAFWSGGAPLEIEQLAPTIPKEAVAFFVLIPTYVRIQVEPKKIPDSSKRIHIFMIQKVIHLIHDPDLLIHMMSHMTGAFPQVVVLRMSFWSWGHSSIVPRFAKIHTGP